MLSFMRDQGAGNSSDHSSTGTGSQGMPSVGGPEAQEYLTVAANSKSLRKSTIMVAVMVGVGLVCLFFMIRKSQPQAASARQSVDDEAKIEAAIGRLTGVRSEMAGRMDEIINKFDKFSNVFQVKVGELSKDPFNGGGIVPQVEEIPVGEDPRIVEAFRRRKMEQEAGMLRLLSIMRSEKGSSCMINEQVLVQGETIEGFMINQIGSNFVELTWVSGGVADGNASKTEEMKTTLKLTE